MFPSLKWQLPSRQEYTTIQDSEDFESNGDIEKDTSASGPSTQLRRSRASVLLSSLSYTLNIVLFAYVVYSVRWSNRGLYSDRAKAVPGFSKVFRSFDQNLTYSSRPSPESDSKWMELAGPSAKDHSTLPHEHESGQGFAVIQNAESYGLPTSGEAQGGMVYGVSVFHQLHCLGGIRTMLWDLVEGRASGNDLLKEYPADDLDPDIDIIMGEGLWHISHCIDFIRQALMCAADVTLEGPVKIQGTQVFAGWEAPHQCANWDEVWDWAQKHKLHQ